MEFGVFILAQQRSYEQSSKYVIDCAVQQTVAAEAAGFDTAWYAEHHFNNYSLSPSPLMLVAHCAGLTKTIRLGTAVCVLPLGYVAKSSAGREWPRQAPGQAATWNSSATKVA